MLRCTLYNFVLLLLCPQLFLFVPYGAPGVMEVMGNLGQPQHWGSRWWPFKQICIKGGWYTTKRVVWVSFIHSPPPVKPFVHFSLSTEEGWPLSNRITYPNLQWKRQVHMVEFHHRHRAHGKCSAGTSYYWLVNFNYAQRVVEESFDYCPGIESRRIGAG